MSSSVEDLRIQGPTGLPPIDIASTHRMPVQVDGSPAIKKDPRLDARLKRAFEELAHLNDKPVHFVYRGRPYSGATYRQIDGRWRMEIQGIAANGKPESWELFFTANGDIYRGVLDGESLGSKDVDRALGLAAETAWQRIQDVEAIEACVEAENAAIRAWIYSSLIQPLLNLAQAPVQTVSDALRPFEVDFHQKSKV